MRAALTAYGRAMRRGHLASALVVTCLVTIPSGGAHAAPLCQGQDPTIVGAPGDTVIGTPGDDVIVTEGATTIDAKAGDDLVCVTGDAGDEVILEAGAGDDTVDSTSGASVRALLGPGVDTFVGGTGTDVVSTGGGDFAGETVSTGDGKDYVTTGRQKKPMQNTIALGPGQDSLILKGRPGTGSVDAGDNRDSLQLWDNGRSEWTIDNRKQNVTVGDVTMQLAGFEVFRTDALKWKSLSFRGGAADEELDVAKFTKAKPDGGVGVDMGNGDDRLLIGALVSGILHGGAGTDTLFVQNDPRGPATGSLWTDLNDGEARINGGDPIKTTSWTHLWLTDFDRNTVRGSAAPNFIRIVGCRATAHAGPGADEVQFTSKGMGCTIRPALRSLTAYGEGGGDFLWGHDGDDTLIGGTGNDTIRCEQGRDVFSGEKLLTC